MGAIPLHYVDLRAFCYATEDDKRVEDALRTFLPEDFPIERADAGGHHGDRIVVLSARVEKADDIREVLDRLGELPELSQVRTELDQRVTENTEFFLRLDKQAAFAGEVQLGKGLTFRAKVEAYPAKKARAVEAAEDILGELEDA